MTENTQKQEEPSEEVQALATTHSVNPMVVRDTAKLDEIVARCNGPEVAKLPPMMRTIVLSAGMRDLRKAMNEKLVNIVFMPLQGNRLGFRTDKDKDNGYDWETVRDALSEGMLRGLRPIGNEINIIAGNFYATKEGFERLVSEWPGLTHLTLEPGVPVRSGEGALVPYVASWMLNGRPDRIECLEKKVPVKNDDGEVVDRTVFDQRIPVRVNAGMGADAILGKAKRKMLARIYERLSGMQMGDGDVYDTTAEVIPTDKDLPPPAAPEQDGRRIKMGKGKANPKKDEAPKKEEPAKAKEPIVGGDGELYDPDTGERIPQ